MTVLLALLSVCHICGFADPSAARPEVSIGWFLTGQGVTGQSVTKSLEVENGVVYYVTKLNGVLVRRVKAPPGTWSVFCEVCGFVEPGLARPVGSAEWLALEAAAHKRWNLWWKDGNWHKAPRIQVEAVRQICQFENRAGNPLRYSGCAADHQHSPDAKPAHAASTAYGIGQFLKSTRRGMDNAFPGQFNWRCAMCQYRAVWVYSRRRGKTPHGLVSRGGNWRGY